VIAGRGARLLDNDGVYWLDLYGGHAVSIVGHGNVRLAEALSAQARNILFYSNVVHSPVRAAASERLCRLAPWGDAKLLYLNSGSEANEAALKIARKATGRLGVVSFEGGFHGRTLGALAATGFDGYRKPARFVEEAGQYTRAIFNDIASMEAAISTTTAAVIIEPIQSMGGMRTMTKEFATALYKRCNEAGALLIFDEVQTAPARSGYWFAGERWGVYPDLITTAKGIGGGFPAGIVLARGKVAATVKSGDQGTTFGGSPMACAAIDTTLQILHEIDGPFMAQQIERRTRDALGDVAEILGHGGLLGVKVAGGEEAAGAATKQLRDKFRVLTGDCPGDKSVIRLMPPLTVTSEELDEGLNAIRSVLVQ
jgi:acetylornithine aminotransferase/acetylornithine/N-succinyldiaminopimelate aminotransferase